MLTFGKEKRKNMYAILLELDYTKNLNEHYKAILDLMTQKGFKKQGNIYFGNTEINSVDCVLAMQELAQKYDWFASLVKDVRMLRIDEVSDLKRVF